MHDLVIRGGTVLDGSGAPGKLADVALQNGVITAIGMDLGPARDVLDAHDLTVTPGFIDIHTHYDAQVFWDPSFTPSCYHGFTSVIAGSCGFSLAPVRPEHHDLMVRTLESVEDMNPDTLRAGVRWEFESFPDYLAAVRAEGILLNFSGFIGHTALRLFVMGEDAFDRAATAAELDAMCGHIRAAMDAGAAGFSTSYSPTHVAADSRPVPSRVGDMHEFLTLAKAVGDSGRGVINLALGNNVPLEDVYHLQPQIGRPITYTALMSLADGRHRAMVALNDRGWRQGAQVWPQVTPRPLSMQFTLEAPFILNIGRHFLDLMGQPRAARLAAYRNAGWRAEALEELKHQVIAIRWDQVHVSESEKFTHLIGRPLLDIATGEGKTPMDVLCDIALAEDLQTRFRIHVANDDDDEVDYLLTRDHVILGVSDAGAHVGQICDAPQATELLGRRVRERGTMSLEYAVHKLTGQPATMLGLWGRGLLKPGYCADIAVFDPKTVGPGPVRRVRDFPANASRLTADAPTGMMHVLVNGTVIRRDGVNMPLSGPRPGQMLKFAAG